MSRPSPSGTAQEALNCDWSERHNSYDIELLCMLEEGFSLFAQFSVSTVGLEPSEKDYNQTQTAPLSVFQPTMTMSSKQKSMGCTKCDKCGLKHDINCILLRYLIWNINEQH